MAALFCVTLHLLMSGRGRPSPPTQIAGNAPNFTHLCSSVFFGGVLPQMLSRLPDQHSMDDQFEEFGGWGDVTQF